MPNSAFLLTVVAATFFSGPAVGNRPERIYPAGRVWSPEVEADAYPQLVSCTLGQRARDIEAMLAAKDAFYKETNRSFDLSAPEARADSVEVTTGSGRKETAGRLILQIVKTCHEIRVGRPLGFWPSQLEHDWRARMGMPLNPDDGPRNEKDFATCLKSFRPELIRSYLDQKSGKARQLLYKEMLEQRVCKTPLPLAIKEGRLRRELDGRD